MTLGDIGLEGQRKQTARPRTNLERRKRHQFHLPLYTLIYHIFTSTEYRSSGLLPLGFLLDRLSKEKEQGIQKLWLAYSLHYPLLQPFFTRGYFELPIFPRTFKVEDSFLSLVFSNRGVRSSDQTIVHSHQRKVAHHQARRGRATFPPFTERHWTDLEGYRNSLFRIGPNVCLMVQRTGHA